MKILVACEFSGIVGAAFTAAGHEVVTCDLLPTEGDRICHQALAGGSGEFAQ